MTRKVQALPSTEPARNFSIESKLFYNMFHNGIIVGTVVGEVLSLHSADFSGACYVAQASLEVMALLPLHLQY